MSKLTDEQVDLLHKLRFRWDVREETWATQFDQLKQFKELHGHCEVGLVADADEDLLGWVRSQRSRLASGKLKAAQKEKLDALGFSWSSEVADRKWDEMYQRLKAYHTQHGNADVPHRWKEDLKLAAWVGQQRQRRKKGMISDEQIQLLEGLGFTWQHRERGSWEDRYQKLIEFKASHGHCDVPFVYEEKPKLGAFVNSMRNKKVSGDLSQQRIELLERVGFQWAIRETNNEDAWETRYTQLHAFKISHGDCNVPTQWPENPQLGCWVGQQRQNRKGGTLQPDRERRLNDMGFDWRSDSHKEDWATRFEQLKAYKQRFGHCRVPVKWTENPQLGVWVSNLRHRQKRGQLSPEQQRMLAEIDFK